MACNCIGGNPCPCQRGGMMVGSIAFAPDLSRYAIPPGLGEALAKAKLHVMTPKERYEQMVSFIYGMQRLSEPGLSIEEIKAMLAKGGIVEPDLTDAASNASQESK